MTMRNAPVLLIGGVLGDSDPESMAWMRAIGLFSQQVGELCKDGTSRIRLNVIYHVDGRLSPNEFEGVRTGRFIKKANCLVVQAAVWRNEEEGKRTVLVGLLHDVVDVAEDYVQKKGLATGLPEIRSILAQLT